jgi:hypothetical protein
MTDLTAEARNVWQSLVDNCEGNPSDKWVHVYLDNAKPDGMSQTTFRAYLATLSKAGVYKPIDGYAWGDVKTSIE